MIQNFKEVVTEEFKDESYDFILLFGSFADGKNHERSDVDIGICARTPLELKTLGYHTAMLETKLGRPVDLIDLHEIYKKNPLLAFEILSRHTPLSIRDEERYIRFKTMAQLYYLDHKPLIEANRRQLLRRIEEGKIGERNYA